MISVTHLPALVEHETVVPESHKKARMRKSAVQDERGDIPDNKVIDVPLDAILF